MIGSRKNLRSLTLFEVNRKGENKMGISDFLSYLMGGGCLLAASWILERFPKYTALAASVKEWIFFGVAAVLGAGSYAVSVYVPSSVIVAVSPYFVILASVFGYVFLGNVFHSTDKKTDNTVSLTSPQGSTVTTSTTTPPVAQ
jgi:drug/metabolite transporter (DMT)-like permease